MGNIFAVLPYLKTSDPFQVGKVLFRSFRNTEGLEKEDEDHLAKILSMLCFDFDRPVEDAVYTMIKVTDDRGVTHERIRWLRAAHTMVTYLITGNPYDHSEQASLYLFEPGDVAPGELDSSLKLVSGYAVTINWAHWLEAVPEKQLLPPVPYPLLMPERWDLADVGHVFETHRHLYWGLEEYIRGKLLAREEETRRFETILRAMEWLNRSASIIATAEEQIVFLSVAFEVLFHDRTSGRRISDELKDHLRGLFGEAPRLSDWVDQFYDTRSRILHEGFAHELRFVAREGRSEEEQLLMDSLVNYGKRLLRMCIVNILHGSLLAEEAGLNAWFMHDKERLQDICKTLRDETKLAEDRLLSVSGLVYDLGEIWVHHLHRRDTDRETIHAAGKNLIETYLEAFDEIEEAVVELMRTVTTINVSDVAALRHAYSKLASVLSSGVATYKGRLWPVNPAHIVGQFCKFAGRQIS